jgi:hypothetical protein
MWLGAALSASALALAGCGSDNGLNMGRVSGVVTYNGQPVELGEVLFVPDSDKGSNGVPSMGPILKDGRYVMSTQSAGDGVIRGFHKVGIRVLEPQAVGTDNTPTLDPETSTGKQMMDAKLANRKTQAKNRRKNQAKPDAPTVSFSGKVHRFLAPQKLANPETSGIRVQIDRRSSTVDFAIAEDGTVKVSQ